MTFGDLVICGAAGGVAFAVFQAVIGMVVGIFEEAAEHKEMKQKMRRAHARAVPDPSGYPAYEVADGAVKRARP